MCVCVCNGGADVEGGFFLAGKLHQDSPLKIVWKKGFIRLFLVGGILWMLLILFASLFHIWSCHSSISFLSGMKLLWLLNSFSFTLLDDLVLVDNPPPST